MKTLISTVSNAAYIIAGIAVWSNTWYVGLALILLGLASSWFHYSGTRVSNAADIIGIYLTLNMVVVYLLSGYGVPLPHMLIGATLVTMIMAAYENVLESLVVIGVQFTIVSLLSLDILGNYLPIFLAAMIFNIPHLRMHGKAPHFFIEYTHGIWHILTALGFYIICS